MRGNTQDAVRRAYTGLRRGRLYAADDNHKIQTHDVHGLPGETFQNVEAYQPYGFKSVPRIPPAKSGKFLDVILGFVFGSASHPLVLHFADPNTRPQKGKPGDAGLWHDKGASMSLTDDGHKFDAGPEKKPHETVVGNASFKVEDGKVTAKVNNTLFIVKDGKILLGSEDASRAVMLDGGPSNMVFAKS